jgi:PKD domain
VTYQLTLAAALCVALAAPAGAQTFSGVKVEPAVAKVGEPVTITGAFDSAGNPNCNLRVDFGDGKNKNFKINQEKDVPLVTTHTYTKPGNYRVQILPRTDLPMLKCKGGDQKAMLKVEAPTPVAAAAAPVKAAGPSCPDGWKLSAAGVSKKSGAYTCTAKAGTALPTAKPECPAPLGYFENKSKGQLGCTA